MKKSTRVAVTGPLAPYAAGYRAELDAQGYSPWTAVSYLYSFTRLSRWLADQRLSAAELDSECVARFVAERPGGRPDNTRRVTPRGMYSLLGYLRRAGVAPAPVTVVSDTGRDALLDEFAAFLRTERGLAENTIDWYRWAAGLFLAAQVGDVQDVGALSAGQINAFVLAQAGGRGAGSLNNIVTALRALLRFLYLRGYTATPLAGAAPRTVGWRDRGPSRGLGAEQVARLLAGCDRRTSIGRRDFAILTVLARLGLRANEVATLRLEDMDWRVGEITVHGKGNRTDRLPMPADVGQAIADYCRRGRPRVGCRALFVQVRAPYAGLTSTAVSKVVEAACRRAGLPEVGAHRLRHTAAAALRRTGAPLFEIGQLLRHQHAVTTAGYARDDEAALAELARRWPGGAP
ncbi:MAG: site-specific integrase [Pseudonocardia sp.]|nr:site-specific integrase [Pseudonocardia sp.]